LCTVLYQKGPSVVTQILDELTKWMEKSNYNTLSELRGKLNGSSQGDTTTYERSQFMKYYSNRG
jgi:dihydroorotate dehydrogenase (fumarate)